jgi:hypothetical protein
MVCTVKHLPGITGNINATPVGVITTVKHTVVSINNTTWTALPATKLSGRFALLVQNQSGVEIKLNGDNTTVGYIGYRMADGNDKYYYNILEDFTLYAKSSAGTVNILVEEVA